MENYQEMINKSRENVKNYEKKPDVAEISFRALDAFEVITRSKTLTEENILKVVNALISHHIGPREIGMKLIGELVRFFPQIYDVVRDLANSPSGQKRFAAMLALYDDSFDYDFSVEIVRKAINDRSTKVREFAVDRAYTRALNPLLPDLIERTKIEENKTVLDSLKYVISIMEQQV